MAYTLQNTTSTTTDHAFPVLAIVVLTSTATALLLITYYYIFVNKCFSNFHHLHLLRRISFLRSRHDPEDPYIAFSPSIWINRGLDDSVIREIPTFQFKKRGLKEDECKDNENENTLYGCVVCLNEFEDNDTVRVLQTCAHAFHIDCIDVWFQSNANCPLCRISVSATTMTRCPIDRVIAAPRSSPQDSEDDFVVIELSGDAGEGGEVLRRREETRTRARTRSRSVERSGRKVGGGLKLKARMRRQDVSIIGNDYECKDDEFCYIEELIVRRSFSLDSAVDRQLYQSVREIIRQNGSDEFGKRGR